MAEKIRAAIIAAGYGTRFLPSTKTIPKEMLPLFTIPTIKFIVDEFIEAGIKDILIISSRRKKVLEDYFDREIELEYALDRAGKKEQLQKIHPPQANISFIRQKTMAGTADAIFLTKDFAGNDPIIIAFPDDIFLGEISCSQQLIDEYKKTKKSVISVQEVPMEEVNRYGILDANIKNDTIEVKGLVEKPDINNAPSNLATYGRYLFTPEYFEYLEKVVKEDKEGEKFHTDAIEMMAKDNRINAIKILAERYDTGEPLAWLISNIKYTLNYTSKSKNLLEFLIKLLKERRKYED